MAGSGRRVPRPRACWSLRRCHRQSSRYIHSAQPPPLPDFSRHPLPLPAPPLRPNRRRRSRPRPPRAATPAASRVFAGQSTSANRRIAGHVARSGAVHSAAGAITPKNPAASPPTKPAQPV
ncbi:hypothetical protein PVAP13_7NG291248 [Panicum virgatum]|uniref:Uncharacterized protein n=1 Tax=Panicum virgatum TaxID=38727 RepID=A0A8T0Q5Z3_PANVG|nr:hypothetical protein PVAP13_7NG291248 [Panicum virgatum]